MVLFIILSCTSSKIRSGISNKLVESSMDYILSNDSPDSNPPYVKIEVELNGRYGAVLDEPSFVIEVLWIIGAIGTISDDCAYCKSNIKI